MRIELERLSLGVDRWGKAISTADHLKAIDMMMKLFRMVEDKPSAVVATQITVIAGVPDPIVTVQSELSEQQEVIDVEVIEVKQDQSDNQNQYDGEEF